MTAIITFEDHDPGGKIRLRMPGDVISQAIFSPCRQYRYILHRRWSEQTDRSVMFVMMNPSTATEDADDPTVRKCRTYAMAWGYNHLIVGNIMAYRATHPKLLLTVADPIGVENACHLREAIERYQPKVICAWGSLPKRLGYAQALMLALLDGLAVTPYALRLNQNGSPAHPLYLPLASQPIAYGAV